MIYISNIAQKYFFNLLKNKKRGTQIRILVTNPGTLNAESKISYCSKNDVKPTDTVLKFKKIIVYVDELSLPYLKNAEIDFSVENFNYQLTIKAPNIKKIKRKNKSFSLTKRIQHFLQLQINPELLKHGGYASLKEITKEGYAIFQFYGNCNGCSMINLTLKNIIEEKLLNNFPEINGIRNFTDPKKIVS